MGKNSALHRCILLKLYTYMFSKKFIVHCLLKSITSNPSTMKRHFLLVLVIFSFGFVPSDLQQQVEAAVKKHIINNADDSSGFQVVQVGKVQKFMTEYYMTDEYKLRIDIAKNAVDLAKKSNNINSV